jgi:CheY-like chemotaxis protein
LTNNADNNNNSIKILVVDDEPDVLLVLKSVLEQQRYYVKTFDKPIQALEHFIGRTIQYDLIITDYRMPGDMSGLDFARAIKDHSITSGNRRKTKIFLITAYETAETSSAFSQALQSNVIDEVIKKPVSNSELINLVEKTAVPWT